MSGPPFHAGVDGEHNDAKNDRAYVSAEPCQFLRKRIGGDTRRTGGVPGRCFQVLQRADPRRTKGQSLPDPQPAEAHSGLPENVRAATSEVNPTSMVGPAGKRAA